MEEGLPYQSSVEQLQEEAEVGVMWTMSTYALKMEGGADVSRKLDTMKDIHNKTDLFE